MSTGAALCGGLLAAMWAADGFRLRQRARALRVLAPSDEPVSDDHLFITRPGVFLDEATRRAASAHARAHDLQVLDLVPARLASWRALVLLSVVDPAHFRGARFELGCSAGDALLVRRDVVERARAAPEVADSLALIQLARTLKLHATADSDLVVAPALASPGLALPQRRRLLRWLFGDSIVLLFGAQMALLVFALASALPWGIAALAAFHLQIFAVTLGTPLAPRDRPWQVALRWIIDVASIVGPTAAFPHQGPTPDELRPTYDSLLARGTTPFFEPARTDCPLCGGSGLIRVGAFSDHYQRKPGRFTLDRCTSCRHVFQNPRLSLEGLAFYYRDFYDGLGAELTATVFANEKRDYRARAEMVAGVAQPERWLDVGAGHGHFCCAARELFPETRFEGLDISESIDEAVRRQWVSRGIRGLFPEVAPQLAAKGERYDVVSMSHYLEHTLDPAAELDAAARVLPPGGLLFIEVPDPESRLSRLFGRGWLPWFQPQHLHFLTAKNLERLLIERDFEPVVWHRGQAHKPAEFIGLAFVAISRVALRAEVPWLPARGAFTRAFRRLVWSASLPVIAVAWILDHGLAPLFRRKGWSNTYRVLARRLS